MISRVLEVQPQMVFQSEEHNEVKTSLRLMRRWDQTPAARSHTALFVIRAGLRSMCYIRNLFIVILPLKTQELELQSEVMFSHEIFVSYLWNEKKRLIFLSI